MRERAFTLVDRAKAVVGNRWLDRAWGLFLGDPLGLVYRATEFSWVVDPPSDWELVVQGSSINASNVQSVEWTEENCPHGAALTATRTIEGLTFGLHTMAFHDAPVLVRTLKMLNLSGEVLTLDRACVDSFNFGTDDVRFHTEPLAAFADLPGENAWQPSSETVTAISGDSGLVLGHERGLRLEGDSGLFRFEIKGPFELPPGRWTVLPSAYVFAFSGSLTTRVAALHQGIAKLISAYRQPELPADAGDPVE
ncbi:MAG: hypothetical protein AMXMBFR84_05280 [Candidatus Hydrogenedentota bacterium]